MDKKVKQEKEELMELIEKAAAGDKKSLETVLLGIQDLVFNLSLRMLGTFPDAEDAAQDIPLKIMTHLSSFKKESSFTTWVFRIAANHLINYKKHMLAHYPLSFEYYGNDILNGQAQDVPDLTQNVDRLLLAEELKNFTLLGYNKTIRTQQSGLILPSSLYTDRLIFAFSYFYSSLTFILPLLLLYFAISIMISLVRAINCVIRSGVRLPWLSSARS